MRDPSPLAVGQTWLTNGTGGHPRNRPVRVVALNEHSVYLRFAPGSGSRGHAGRRFCVPRDSFRVQFRLRGAG